MGIRERIAWVTRAFFVLSSATSATSAVNNFFAYGLAGAGGFTPR